MLKRKGFTLIEVLIVVIILGILATIAVPQFTKIVTKAKASEATTNIAAINTGLEIWKLEHSGNYPSYATAALLNTGLDITITADEFTYAVTGGATYVVTATNATDGTIIYTQGADPWSGTHEGVPAN